jgi:hypothetical protein
MADLIATRGMTYATRALQAGDPFQASNQDARILIAIKKARLAAETDVTAPAAPAAPPHPATIEQLRDQAARLGITVSTRWGEKRLLEEIAKVASA